MDAQYRGLEDLALVERELLQRALSVASRALNPMSSFQVGATVRTLGGQVFNGTFFESSSFPLGICAESAALSAAITAGVRQFESIAVVGGDPLSSGPSRPVTPCGGCRQRIYDVTGGALANIRVLCSNLSLTEVLYLNIVDLLPLAFGADDLPGRLGGRRG
jgi:cytidine deaminase